VKRAIVLHLCTLIISFPDTNDLIYFVFNNCGRGDIKVQHWEYGIKKGFLNLISILFYFLVFTDVERDFQYRLENFASFKNYFIVFFVIPINLYHPSVGCKVLHLLKDIIKPF
jgi:hypothetical protein